jgi:hypothetical protein
MIMNHEFLMTIFPISFSLQGPVDIFGLSFDTGSGAAYTHSHTAYMHIYVCSSCVGGWER